MSRIVRHAGGGALVFAICIIALNSRLLPYGADKGVELVAIAGMFWGIGATVYLLGKSLVPSLKGQVDKMREKTARDELLDCKKLLDEGLLSQEEFDLKSKQLKKVILKNTA